MEAGTQPNGILPIFVASVNEFGLAIGKWETGKLTDGNGKPQGCAVPQGTRWGRIRNRCRTDFKPASSALPV